MPDTVSHPVCPCCKVPHEDPAQVACELARLGAEVERFKTGLEAWVQKWSTSFMPPRPIEEITELMEGR